MTVDEARHLQRRLTFAATPASTARDLSIETAFNRIFSNSRQASTPVPPDCVRDAWTNSALRPSGMSDAQYDALRVEQLGVHRRDIEIIRQWWLREMIGGAAPLGVS